MTVMIEVPGFELLAPLGGGGAATVYKAINKRNGNEVALKIYRSEETTSETFLRRYQRELAIMKSVQHPGIVNVFGHVAVKEENLFVLVMELVDGESLRSVLGRRRLSVQAGLGLAVHLCDILAHVHQKGVAHLDLKPENILLSKKGKLKLTDFGISQGIFGKLRKEGLVTTTVSGTQFYMPPESYLEGYVPSNLADIYAVGVILHEMVVGHRPLGGQLDVNEIEPASFRKAMTSLLTKLLHPDKAQRYQTMGDVGAIVRPLYKEMSAAPKAEPIVQPGPAQIEDALDAIASQQETHQVAKQAPSMVPPTAQRGSLQELAMLAGARIGSAGEDHYNMGSGQEISLEDPGSPAPPPAHFGQKRSTVKVKAPAAPPEPQLQPVLVVRRSRIRDLWESPWFLVSMVFLTALGMLSYLATVTFQEALEEEPHGPAPHVTPR